MSDIKYQRIVTSEAMNKRPRQCGLSIHETVVHGQNMSGHQRTISLYAINPKTGMTTQLRLEIPAEDLQAVIDELQKLV